MKITVHVGDLERTTARLRKIADGISERVAAHERAVPHEPMPPLVTSSIDHTAVCPGRKLGCDQTCGESASYFRRCRTCRRVLSRCSAHVPSSFVCCP